MSQSKKFNIGPLPEPLEDAGRYEETQILWGRVLGFIVLAVVLLSTSLAWLLSDDEPMSPTASTQTLSDSVPSSPVSKPMSEPAPISDSAREPANPPSDMDNSKLASPSQNMAMPAEPHPTSSQPAKTLAAVAEGEPEPAAQPEEAAMPAEESEAATNATHSAVISPVTILREGMQRAELTLALKDGQPVSPQDYNVKMSDEGIIKVILYTEMKGLRGTVLYHDWYRGEQRMARVKIPVNVNAQSSYSSKFINRQMTGDWTVKVADQNGELFAQANFRVE